MQYNLYVDGFELLKYGTRAICSIECLLMGEAVRKEDLCETVYGTEPDSRGRKPPLGRAGLAASDAMRSFVNEHGIWFLALCCGNIWIGWMNGAHALEPSNLWRSLAAVAMICTLLLAAIYGWRHPGGKGGIAAKRDGFLLDWPIAALMAAFTLPTAGMLVPEGLFQLATVGGTIFTEIGMAWLFIRWGCYISNLGLRETVACIFGAHVVGCSAKLILYFVPAQMVAIPIALLPLVSVFALRRACRKQAETCDSASREKIIWCSGQRGSWGPLWKIAAFVVVYRLIFNCVQGSGASISLSTVCCIAEIAVAILILYMLLIRSGSFTFQQVWSIFLILLGVAVLFSASSALSGIGASIKAATGSLLVMFIWLVFADISHHSNLHPFVVFGVARLAYEIPTLVICIIPGIDTIELQPFFICALLFCLLAFSVLFFDLRDPTLSLVFSDFQKRDDTPEPDAIQAACSRASARAGLTSRESDVLLLLCQGRTRAYIAETLYLSENTVRGHTQHIYEKLEVHSKTELQKKLGV